MTNNERRAMEHHPKPWRSVTSDERLPIALTIAGSDPSGGAGIQADLKTFTALGVYGMSVITAVTSQNTQKVNSVYPLPAKIVREQLEAVLSDIKPDVVKIGMLANSGIITVVADIIKKYKLKNVILDPVMAAKDGTPLLVGATLCGRPKKKGSHIGLPLQELIRQTFLITPNIDEAEILTGIKISKGAAPTESITKAAEKLIKMGAKNVLIKGGHLRPLTLTLSHKGERGQDVTQIPSPSRGEGQGGGDMCKDFLFSKGKAFRAPAIFSRQKIPTKNTHGTGCTYSSAIAGFMAMAIHESPKRRGEVASPECKGGETPPLQDAVQKARDYLQMAIKNSIPIGKGNGPVNHLVLIKMREEMKKAVEKLNNSQTAGLIPEVQSNLAYALKNADNLNETLGFPGRVIRLNDKIKTLAEPCLGASKHIGKVVLTAMRYDPSSRAAMNIKFSGEIINICKKINLTISEFDRGKEPRIVKNKEGQTLEWGTDIAIRVTAPAIPDIIFDRGAVGKEAMIRVLGKNPDDVAEKIIAIAREL